MAHDDLEHLDCPVCGLEMKPPKKALPGTKNPPAFFCYACGVTALGDHSSKLGRC